MRLLDGVEESGLPLLGKVMLLDVESTRRYFNENVPGLREKGRRGT